MNIDEQKAKLLHEQSELENDLNALGRRGQSGSWMVVPDENQGNQADPIDNADITEDFEEKIARLNILEEQYVQVSKALEAIKNKTYGLCEVDGEAIAEKRLLANPSATTCVAHTK